MKNSTEKRKKNRFRLCRLSVFLTITILFSLYAFGQNSKQRIKSLLDSVKIVQEDINKFNLYCQLSNEYLSVEDTTKSLEHLLKALELTKKINYELGEAKALLQIGNLYGYKGLLDTDKSISYTLAALEIFEKLKNIRGIADCNLNIGNHYINLENTKSAVENLKKALSEYEKINEKTLMAECHILIGLALKDENKPDEAIGSYNQALKIYKAKNDTFMIGSTYQQIGNTYILKKNYEKALYYHNESKNISEIMKDNKGIADSYMDIGNICTKKKDYNKALSNFLSGLKYYQISNDSGGIAYSFEEIAHIYRELGRYKKSIESYKMAEKILKELNELNINFGFYKGLSMTYAKLNDFENAYYYRDLHSRLYDSIMETYLKMKNTLENTQVRYQIDKNLKERELSKQLMAEKELQIKQQKIINFTISLGIISLSLFLFWIYFGIKKVRKQNKLIFEQKILIEEKHKEIIDSINYAERIQRSFLATKDLLDENLVDYFVFFKPKDVVSGDFYWATNMENGNFLYVTADSTGHGVPGAIMSLLNIFSLEKSIEKLQEPAAILNATRESIIQRLKQDGSSEGGKDGMDCSLVILNSDKSKLRYAAANNPIWIARKNNEGLTEIQENLPDKMPVGKHERDNLTFNQNEIKLEPGDIIYTLTDGMPDQFGGPKGKKYKYAALKNFLIAISHLPLQEQKIKLETEFETWKGQLEQVDDVCIIGVKI